ncbi:MAG: hypothetical protein HON65_10225 [Rhodospirillales bacterium]|nr:hypothetical protein [Rhodospirillales bacterium]
MNHGGNENGALMATYDQLVNGTKKTAIEVRDLKKLLTVIGTVKAAVVATEMDKAIVATRKS